MKLYAHKGQLSDSVMLGHFEDIMLSGQNMRFLIGLNGLVCISHSLHHQYRRFSYIYNFYTKLCAFKGLFSDSVMLGHFEDIKLAGHLKNFNVIQIFYFHNSLLYGLLLA